jgi:vacuolar-type H+-ATPase subunit C/Vma6
VVRASARKGQLLSDQQLMDLATSRDLKELLNRIKERYPTLALNVTPSLKELEDLLLKDYRDEVDEFIKMCPGASPLLQLMKREIEEGEADLLKQHLGILSVEGTKGQPKKMGKEDVISQLSARGFGSEVKEANRIFEKYKVPAMVDSVFARYRILRMLDAAKNLGGGSAEQLREYLRLKIDVFNVITVLRGIRNGIDRKALEEVLIPRGGSVRREDLVNALKQADEGKALAYLKDMGLPKVEDVRAIERSFEKEVSKTLTHTYYHGYAGIGAIVGYLELKLREVKDLIRLANAISRGMEPKRVAQDFIF